MSPSPAAPTTTAPPTPTATPGAPRIAPGDLRIREVDTAEALAEAGLTHVRRAAGEEVPWAPGVLLLDVKSGEVEGWVCAGGTHACPSPYLSPSNRFLGFSNYVHDRAAGRTYLGLPVYEREPRHEGRLGELIGWGVGAGERLLIRGASGPVVLDSSLQPVAQRDGLAGGFREVRHGRYVAAYDYDTVRIADLEWGIDPEAVELIETALPSDIRWPRVSELVEFDAGPNGVTLVVPDQEGKSRIIRYGWDGTLLSDTSIPLSFDLNTSPDGRMVAGPTFRTATGDAYGDPSWMVISVFDAATGEEIYRILGATTPGVSVADWRVEDGVLWPADSSGVIVGTTLGDRLVTFDGRWQGGAGWPAPDEPGVFARGLSVTDPSWNVRASLEVNPWQHPDEDSFAVSFAGWGDHSGELRVEFYALPRARGGPGYQVPPLPPVIERPPFNDRLLVEVVADTCLNLRHWPSLDAAVLACLPHGVIAETLDFYINPYRGEWMRLRTDDGIEGWASAEYLRWHSDGMRLVLPSVGSAVGAPGSAEVTVEDDENPRDGDRTAAYAELTCASGKAVPNPAVDSELVDDCARLLALRDTLAGTGTLNWTPGTAMTNWTGLTMAGTPQRVTKLQLANSGLTGRVSGLVGELAGLTELRLNGNRLTGRLPSKLGQLTKLTHAYIGGNALTGCLPPLLRTVANNDAARVGLADCAEPVDVSFEYGPLPPGTYLFRWDEESAPLIFDIPAGLTMRVDAVVIAEPGEDGSDAPPGLILQRHKGDSWICLDLEDGSECNRWTASPVEVRDSEVDVTSLFDRLAESAWVER